MEFQVIREADKIFPGEYLLHVPRNQIVMCGAYINSSGTIRALSNGQLIEDSIKNFKKIVISKQGRRQSRGSRCKGCQN